MLYIFYGPDDYTKKLHIKRLLTGLSLPVERFGEGEGVGIESLLGGDLFGGVKVSVFDNALQKLVLDANVEAIKQSSNHFIFSEDSLDKRLSFTKKLLADKSITTKEFLPPEGAELLSWMGERALTWGASLSKVVASKLLERMGTPATKNSFTDKPVSLENLDFEIQKLATYAQGEITEAMVVDLVAEDASFGGFDIINALGEKNKPKAFSMCEYFFQNAEGTDEKAKLIQLNSLLADQLRSILVLQGFIATRAQDGEILSQTGWKPGRLFVVKKIAGRFDQKKVLETLSKLESLDIELKTSNTPPHVLIDLILAQVI